MSTRVLISKPTLILGPTLSVFGCNWSIVYARNSPKSEFWTFYHFSFVFSCFSVPRKQRFNIGLKSGCEECYLCLNSIFHKLGIWCHLSLHPVVSVSIPVQQMTFLLWTVATPPVRLLRIPGALRKKKTRSLQWCFFHPPPSGFPLNSVGPPVCFSRRNVQTNQLSSVDSFAPHLTRTSNTDCSKSAEMLQKSMTDRCPTNLCTKVLLRVSLWWKNLLMMHNMLLQLSCSRRFTLSFWLASTSVFPNLFRLAAPYRKE